MSNRFRVLGLTARVGLVAVALGLGGMSAAAPASAGTDGFGSAVYRCATMMLPYSIDSRGAITMSMPDGSIMHWASFGEMVTYMRAQQMC